MKLGIITDIHGNTEALLACLSFFSKQNLDKVICLGDIVNPLKSSLETLLILNKNDIPIIKGNHEDYLINGFRDKNNIVNSSYQFNPVKQVLQTFDQTAIEMLENLPSVLQFSEKNKKLILCHASLHSNSRGWHFGADEKIESEISAAKADMVVCGHWHQEKKMALGNTKLITVGSTGIPLNHNKDAECAIISFLNNEWSCEFTHVPFDHQKTTDAYLESGWFHSGGAIAWIIFTEFATGQRRMSFFFRYLYKNSLSPQVKADWDQCAKDFLTETGDWNNLIYPLL